MIANFFGKGSISIRTFKLLLLMIFCFILNFFNFLINNNSNPWQLMYLIPLLIGAFVYNEIGSLIVGFILVLINSPLVLFTKYTYMYENSSHWIIRSFSYILIALIFGRILRELKNQHFKLLDDKLKSYFSGYYNTSKLVKDLEKLNVENQSYDLVFMNLLNLDELRKYIDSEVYIKLLNTEFDRIVSNFENSQIYSYSSDQYILLIKDNEIDDTVICNLLINKIEQILNSNLFDQYSVKFLIKCGIINCFIDKNPRELIQKARITSERGSLYESGIYIFDKKYYEKRQLYYEVSLSLGEAIKNNELFIVYQPIIDLKTKEVCSCEALLRWDRGVRKPVSPTVFITVAEQTGLIIKVTQWLIENTIKNQKKWALKSINLKQSINVSVRELVDDSFQNWMNEILKMNNLSCKDFNIEITERVLSSNDIGLRERLSELREKGCTI